ncbi:MAG: response regulator [Deltaproteobacteria bacterium]|nr:response regulator [Deltaproteobacteria bacterium]
MSAKPIRVLIADDSQTARAALAAMLTEHGVQVVGEAADGHEAVALCKALRPDVVTMDVRMPGLDGLQATEAIMADAPARVLLVCGVTEAEQLDLSFRAVAAGALELVPKPLASEAGLRAWGAKVAEAVRLMVEVPVVRRVRGLTPLQGSPRVPEARPARGSLKAIGIAASTGGPPVLARILSALPANLPVPVLLAQHIAPGFTEGLRRWLSAASPLPVKLARHGQPAEAGVWLPPDHCDLEWEAGRLRTPFSDGPYAPSGDRLLTSLAVLGGQALGFVLTGMGDDGARGLLALRKSGGRTFAQDSSTSAVFGMPHAAHTLGAAQDLVALDRIAPLILELA